MECWTVGHLSLYTLYDHKVQLYQKFDNINNYIIITNNIIDMSELVTLDHLFNRCEGWNNTGAGLIQEGIVNSSAR